MSDTLTKADLTELVTLVRAVGRSAVMPHFRTLRPEDVQAKTGPLDLVTIADEAAEAQLTAALSARHPTAVVVGEEATSRDATLLDRIADADALDGHGAWLERRDGGIETLKVAAPAPVAEMSGALSWRFMPEPTKSQVCARLPRLAGAWDYDPRAGPGELDRASWTALQAALFAAD